MFQTEEFWFRDESKIAYLNQANYNIYKKSKRDKLS